MDKYSETYKILMDNVEMFHSTILRSDIVKLAVQIDRANSEVNVEADVMPNERELIDYYNSEESQEWLNASLGKQQANGAVAGHWQKEKPEKECYFVYRDNKEDNYPGLYEAKLDENILCVFNIQDDEFIYTMEEMADGEFFIIGK